MATTVVNRRHNQPYDVYIGRGSRYGNPYSHLPASRTRKGTIQVASRQEALDRYTEWLDKQEAADPDFLTPLRGKVLSCWCRPLAGFQGVVMCHAQIVAARCDGIRPEDVV